MKRNFKNKLACANYTFEKLHACFHRAFIKRIFMFLELLHDDLIKSILKNKNLLTAFNETLYVFTLLNDAIQRFEIYFLKQKTILIIIICFKHFQNFFIRNKCRTFRFRNDDDNEFFKEFK